MSEGAEPWGKSSNIMTSLPVVCTQARWRHLLVPLGGLNPLEKDHIPTPIGNQHRPVYSTRKE